TAQKDYDWPNTFRSARFIPAVEYIQAARARTMLMEAMAKVFENIDVIVTPSNGPQLTCTNLTGHPAVILPNGFRGDDAPKPVSEDPGDFTNSGGPGTRTSLTCRRRWCRQADLWVFARASQEATGLYLRLQN